MAVSEKVKEIIVEKLNVDPAEVTPDASLMDDLGADSLDLADLNMELEDEFDISIPEDGNVKTVGDVIKFIEDNKKDS